METAKAIVSLHEGKLEFEGPESFVSKQLEIWRQVIADSMKAGASGSDTGRGGEPSSQAGSSHKKGLKGFEHVFEQSGSGIQILKVTGGNKAEKMVTIALLLTYANKLMGIEPTTSEAIRAACKQHGCLDGPNFSSRVKARKEWFVFDGKGSSMTLKLTTPGTKKADEVANGFNT